MIIGLKFIHIYFLLFSSFLNAIQPLLIKNIINVDSLFLLNIIEATIYNVQEIYLINFIESIYLHHFEIYNGPLFIFFISVFIFQKFLKFFENLLFSLFFIFKFSFWILQFIKLFKAFIIILLNFFCIIRLKIFDNKLTYKIFFLK